MQALRRIPVVLGLAVTLLLVGAVAYAAIPGTNGAINGCVNNRTGVLRVVDAAKGQRCIERPQALRETPISWNQRGPAAPSGPGTGGGVTSTDQFEGVPCDTKSAQPGVTRVRYWQTQILMFCQRPGDPDIPVAAPTAASSPDASSDGGVTSSDGGTSSDGDGTSTTGTVSTTTVSTSTPPTTSAPRTSSR